MRTRLPCHPELLPFRPAGMVTWNEDQGWLRVPLHHNGRRRVLMRPNTALRRVAQECQTAPPAKATAEFTYIAKPRRPRDFRPRAPRWCRSGGWRAGELSTEAKSRNFIAGPLGILPLKRVICSDSVATLTLPQSPLLPHHCAALRRLRAVSSVGRASRLHREGQRFEPVTAHQQPLGLPLILKPLVKPERPYAPTSGRAPVIVA